jgi:hypothetical protein
VRAREKRVQIRGREGELTVKTAHA